MRYLIALAVLICGCAYTPPNKVDEATAMPVIAPMPITVEPAAETVSDDCGESETMSAPLVASPIIAPQPAEPAKPEALAAPSCAPCYQPCHRRFFRRR